MAHQIGVKEDGTPIFSSPPNHQPRKRVRRRAKKMARNAYQRENVLTVLDCYLPSQRALTEREKAAQTPPKKRETKHTYQVDNYEGNHKINHHIDYQGVVTHPVESFTKDKTYQHHELSTPSHLWCDVVHATDADVTKGNRSK